MITKFELPNYIFASKSIRFLNFIIDVVAIRVIRAFIYFLLAFLSSNTDFNSFSKVQNFLIFTFLMFVYYFIFEICTSRTLGKYFTNTIVVKEDGSKPNIGDIALRSLVRLIPIEYLTFLRGRKLGWHDDFSKTYVVRRDKLKESISDFNDFQNS